MAMDGIHRKAAETTERRDQREKEGEGGGCRCESTGRILSAKRERTQREDGWNGFRDKV
ncbi:hypothetical protein DM860_009856 [Cuscuta australis]|uniref:Uncharacterized protein n=1 Tax=Cuscuta australis TaxID=267555 RepID=A0A328DC62_9ASTE|nr:hypothetical protein DM860_009856 [Cuscuta australis]